MEAVNLSREQSDEILAISKRDGGWHDRVLEQAREGRITISEEGHRGLFIVGMEKGGDRAQAGYIV